MSYIYFAFNIILSEMWPRVLNFSAILLISLTLADATKVKLIPNGNKTVHKNGVTHQMIKYIIVPENSNVVYEKDDSQFRVGAERTALAGESSNIHKLIHDTIKDNRGRPKVGKINYHGNNHHHQHHNFQHSESRSYASNDEANIVNEGNNQILSSFYKKLTVPEKTVAYHSSYQKKPDKNIAVNFTVNQGGLSNYKNEISTYIPSKLKKYKSQYEIGGIGNQETVDFISQDSHNDMVNEKESEETVYDTTNTQPIILHGNNSDGKTHNISVNNNMILLENDENLNVPSDNRIEQSNDWTVEKESNNDANIHILDYSETEKLEKNQKSMKQDSYNNEMKNTDPNVATSEAVASPVIFLKSDNNQSDENEQFMESGKKTLKLRPLDHGLENYDYLASDETTPSNSQELDKNLSTPEDFTNTDFDTSDPEFKSDTKNTNIFYSEYHTNPKNLLWRKNNHNVRHNAYGIDYTWKPYSGAKIRTNYNYFCKDELPGAHSSQSSKLRKALRFEKNCFKIPDKLQSNGKTGFYNYNTDNVISGLNKIDTGFKNINHINSGFNIFKSDSSDANTNNVKTHETRMIPVKFPYYSNLNHFLKLTSKADIRGFILINGKIYIIDSTVLKYLLSHKSSNSLNENNIDSIVKMNGDKYAIDDNLLQYILTRKQSNSINEHNDNSFINGNRYAIEDNVLKYIIYQQQPNGVNKKFVNILRRPNVAKITEPYILRNQNKNYGSIILNDNERHITDIANNKIYENYIIRNIYNTKGKIMNELDNNNQDMSDNVFFKYNTIKKTPANYGRVQYIHLYNKPDTENFVKPLEW